METKNKSKTTKQKIKAQINKWNSWQLVDTFAAYFLLLKALLFVGQFYSDFYNVLQKCFWRKRDVIC